MQTLPLLTYFLDTPHPIDPFTFVPLVSEEGQSSQVDHNFARLALPGAVRPLVGTAASSTSKRTISSAPKTVFPEAHLDDLLAKITDLATPNFTFLVESIYQDLRVHKIKKNAIEAKLREIGEKSKEKKIWVIKPGWFHGVSCIHNNIKHSLQALHQLS